jgi:hypothetical protein
VILDAGPLGIVTKRRGIPDADACRHWIAAGIRSSASFIVPAVAYYEVRRELERLNSTTGIARLDAFCAAVPGRYRASSSARCSFSPATRISATPGARSPSGCCSRAWWTARADLLLPGIRSAALQEDALFL